MSVFKQTKLYYLFRAYKTILTLTKFLIYPKHLVFLITNTLLLAISFCFMSFNILLGCCYCWLLFLVFYSICLPAIHCEQYVCTVKTKLILKSFFNFFSVFLVKFEQVLIWLKIIFVKTFFLSITNFIDIRLFNCDMCSFIVSYLNNLIIFNPLFHNVQKRSGALKAP